MRIEDLDEFQGLTPQMVREWLRGQGFDMRLGGLLHAGRYLVEWEPIESAWRSTEASLYAIAGYRNQSVQALLREINPRMRPWPSKEAQAAHTGTWLCMANGIITAGIFESSAFVYTQNQVTYGMLEDLAKHELFWPCDEHGTKVRWPEKDWVML